MGVRRWLVDLSDTVGHFSDLFDSDALDREVRLNGQTGQEALYALPMASSVNHLHVWKNLLLVGKVTELEPHAEVRLRARIGIATGQVGVGDLVGEGAARDVAVVGSTPNLAARLQALHSPTQS
jgi:class 3 adenylate cyclase